jgi:hypothetical protein
MHCEDLGRSGDTSRWLLNRRHSWHVGLAFCLALSYSVDVEVCLSARAGGSPYCGGSELSMLEPLERTIGSSSDEAITRGATAKATASGYPVVVGRRSGANHKAAQAIHGWELV